jgi:O-succinylbenzoic acid--CoA ligase
LPTLVAEARTLGFPVLTTYGMTETASGIAVGGAGTTPHPDPGTLRPLPGVRLRVAPSTAGSDDAGEIEVAGAMVFAGYLGDEAATAERLRDGWLRTGDLGRIDAEGRLQVLGRRDELIISGGENVHPAEVEAVLRSLPGVADAAVVGQPDSRWGSVPVAAVVAAPGADVDGEALRERCRERLAPYKVPQRVLLVTALPRNAGGKLVRARVAELLAHDELEGTAPGGTSEPARSP